MSYRRICKFASPCGYFAIALIVACLGCNQQDFQREAQRAIDKQEFFEVLQAVQSGDSKGIFLLEKQIDDEDLRQLVSLTELHSLAIPHARNVTNASMEIIANIPGLKNLDLAGTGIDNEGLEPLRNHPTITRLVVNETRVTDAGLAIIATIPNLEVLELFMCFITNDGLRHIGTMKNLERISLDGTSITDRGLPFLYPLRNLRRLQFRGTGVSDGGREALMNIMPNVEVPWDD